MKQDFSLSRSIEQLYHRVQAVLETSRESVYRAANSSMVHAYWDIGKLIVEEEQKGETRGEYGKQIVEGLSKRLLASYGKGYTPSNLWYMRQFYRTFKNLHALRGELSWTHYRLLLKVEKEEARQFYLEEAIVGRWSTRTLERQINSLYYERILLSGNESRPAVKRRVEDKKGEMQSRDIIKDPYVLEFLNLPPNSRFYEKELEQALIDKLQYFLLELGRGFSFVSRQYRISAEDEHYYIDLVFYNFILKCFLLVDLEGRTTNAPGYRSNGFLCAIF
jgi:predicted nuclease of restriction endonuclease-like (RecB) superfamily